MTTFFFLAGQPADSGILVVTTAVENAGYVQNIFQIIIIA